MPNISASFGKLEQPQKRGQATEAILRAAFVVRDIPVLVPAFDNEPYDFVVELGGSYYRIQAKTAYDGQRAGTVRFETRSTRVKAAGYERERYDGLIDYFTVYSPETDGVYLVPVADAPEGCMTIRYREPERGGGPESNWAEEYRLDAVLDSLEESTG